MLLFLCWCFMELNFCWEEKEVFTFSLFLFLSLSPSLTLTGLTVQVSSNPEDFPQRWMTTLFLSYLLSCTLLFLLSSSHPLSPPPVSRSSHSGWCLSWWKEVSMLYFHCLSHFETVSWKLLWRSANLQHYGWCFLWGNVNELYVMAKLDTSFFKELKETNRLDKRKERD